jgi:hypothetical protein
VNQQRPVMNQVLGGLGQIVNTGLFRTAAKNWWITAPLGLAAYTVLRERHKKGQLTLANAISDLTPMVTLVATIVILNNVLEQREGATPAPVAARLPLGPVKDASFTPMSRNDQPIPAIPVSGAMT